MRTLLIGGEQIDIVSRAGWANLGAVDWLKRGAALDEKWQVSPIGREAWPPL